MGLHDCESSVLVVCVQSHLKTITMAIMRALNGDNSEGKSYFFFETDRIRNAKVLQKRKASPVCKTIERGHRVVSSTF